MNMMISARPTANITIMITQETPKYDAEMVHSVIIFERELISTLQNLFIKYPINSVSIYGPFDYISKLKEKIEKIYNKEVILVKAGV